MRLKKFFQSAHNIHENGWKCEEITFGQFFYSRPSLRSYPPKLLKNGQKSSKLLIQRKIFGKQSSFRESRIYFYLALYMIDNLPKYEDIPCCQFFSIRSIVTPKMPKLLKNGRNWPYNAKFLPNNAHFRNHSLFKRQFCIRMIIGENMKIFLVANFSLFDRLWRQKCQNCWKMVKIRHIIRIFYKTKLISGIIHCFIFSSIYGW